MNEKIIRLACVSFGVLLLISSPLVAADTAGTGSFYGEVVMRGFWFAGWLWILALGMVVLSSDHARAEGKTGEVNKKYHGLVKALGEKIESEEEFDLSKPEELHKLAEYLGNGEIM